MIFASTAFVAVTLLSVMFPAFVATTLLSVMSMFFVSMATVAAVVRMMSSLRMTTDALFMVTVFRVLSDEANYAFAAGTFMLVQVGSKAAVCAIGCILRRCVTAKANFVNAGQTVFRLNGANAINMMLLVFVAALMGVTARAAAAAAATVVTAIGSLCWPGFSRSVLMGFCCSLGSIGGRGSRPFGVLSVFSRSIFLGFSSRLGSSGGRVSRPSFA